MGLEEKKKRKREVGFEYKHAAPIYLYLCSIEFYSRTAFQIIAFTIPPHPYVTRPGFEPGLFWIKTRRVAYYTIGQFISIINLLIYGFFCGHNEIRTHLFFSRDRGVATPSSPYDLLSSRQESNLLTDASKAPVLKTLVTTRYLL